MDKKRVIARTPEYRTVLRKEMHMRWLPKCPGDQSDKRDFSTERGTFSISQFSMLGWKVFTTCGAVCAVGRHLTHRSLFIQYGLPWCQHPPMSFGQQDVDFMVLESRCQESLPNETSNTMLYSFFSVTPANAWAESASPFHHEKHVHKALTFAV